MHSGPVVNVPVFTVKLYGDSFGSFKCFSAGRLEVDRFPDGAAVLRAIGPQGETVEEHRISHAGPACWAVIENASGHTTEIIRPRSGGPPRSGSPKG